MRVSLTAIVVWSVFASSSAWSLSAVAIGLPDDVAKGGFAMGIARNYGTQGQADSEALQQCLGFKDAPDSTRALCKIVLRFANQCFAVAMDPEPGTPGVGYRTATMQSDADYGATMDCKQTSQYDRANFCKVTYRVCDVTKSN